MADYSFKGECENCHSRVSNFDIVHLSSEDKTRVLCLKCYNKSIAEYAGVKFDHVDFDPISLQDADSKVHEFHFRVRLLGIKVIIEAFEILDDLPGGFMFSVLGNVEDDILKLFQILFERMRRAMRQKHIQFSSGHGFQLTEDDIVRGRIESEEYDDMIPRLVVDGKEISWDEFGHMLMTYEGFNFKLEIYDKSEER